MCKNRVVFFCLLGCAGLLTAATIYEQPESTVFTAETRVDDIWLEKSFAETGAIFAEILPEELPDGYSESSPPTILRLRVSGSGEMLILCLKNSRPHLAVRGSDNQWREVTAQRALPLRKRAQIAVCIQNGGVRFFINGVEDAVAENLGVGAYDLLEVGRNFNQRQFVGTMYNLSIDDAVPSPEVLREKAGDLFALKQEVVPTSLLSEPAKFPRYKALQCVSNEMQLLNGGIGVGSVVAWRGAKDCSLLVSTLEGYLGEGTFLYQATGRRPDGMPDYQLKKILSIKGKKFQEVSLPDGRFDLLASKGSKIYLYDNSGPAGQPEFSLPGVEVTPALGAVTSAPLGDWAVGDVDGDDVPDMLLTSGRERRDSFWPDYENPWKQKDLPNTGFGKGYDINDRWLGERFNSALFFAKGSFDDKGRVRFGIPQKIYLGSGDFQVQWRLYLSMTPTLLDTDGGKWIVLFGDCDNLLALPVTETSPSVRCGTAVSLLKDNGRMIGSYFTSALSCADFDGDGQDEIFAYGNSGRAIVLKGDRPGQFAEQEALRYSGGFVAGDPLAVPCRVEWNGDDYPDLLIGDASGYLTFRRGTVSPTVYGPPQWVKSDGQVIFHQAGPSGSFQGPPERRWGYLQPVVADWDGDGNPDVIVNDIHARMQLYRRGESLLDLQKPESFTLNGNLLPVAWRSRPAVLSGEYHVAGDNRPCLLYMNIDGDLAFAIPEAVGSTRIEKTIALKYDNGNPIRISAPCGMWGRTKFAVCDWDLDGRWDVLFGTNKGTQRVIKSVKSGTNATPFFMRNIGSNDSPVFEYPQPIKLKDGQLIDFDVHVCSVWPTDLDGDGKPDLIVGGEDGRVYYFYRKELDI